MSCSTVFDRLRLVSEKLPPDLFQLASYRSPWLNAIDRAEYEQGQGINGKTFTVNRIEPSSDEESWSYVLPTGTTSMEGETGLTPNNCNVTYNDVPVGFNEATYHPELFGLKGPTICQDDLSIEWKARDFLAAYVRKLAIRAQRSWERRYEAIYMAATRKVIADASLPISAVGDVSKMNHTTDSTKITNVALAGATSDLTQEMLDVLAIELMNEGATNPDEAGYISIGEDGPIFTLNIGIQASQRILKNNTEFRNDIRYAQMGAGNNTSELMKRMGATRVIKNFRHMPDLHPARFWYNTTDATAATQTTAILKVANAKAALLSVGQPVTGTGIPVSTTITAVGAADSHSSGFAAVTMSAAATASATITATFGSGTAGKYSRVPTWTEAASTSGKGKQFTVSTNWKNARFEAATIITKNVFVSEILRPVNAAGNMSWSPKNYMGEWQFVTGGHKFAVSTTGCADPMEKLGAHFAEFRHAPKPKFPEQGFTIIFKRCDTTLTAVTC